MIQTKMSSFRCKLECIISKSDAKIEWSDLSFVNLLHKQHLHETKTTECKCNSLTAGAVYGTSL